MSTHPESDLRDGEVVDLPERSIVNLLRDIKSGAVNPRLLTVEEKKLCVHHLSAEFLSASEIAQIMKTSERTVYRFRKQIQEDQAITPDPEFTKMIAGRIWSETETLRTHVHRVLRDKDSPHAVRVEAARVSHEMLIKTVESFQSMGFVHTAAVRTEAELTVHNGDIESLEHMREELERLAEITQRLKTDASNDPQGTNTSETPKGDSQ